MDFAGIKNKRLAILEQACERYAIMAYETASKRLAIGMKSIRYSYDNHPDRANVGLFTAEFVPQETRPNKTERAVLVNWLLEALNNGQWRLFEGTLATHDEYLNQPKHWKVQWSFQDGQAMKIRSADVYDVSAGAGGCPFFEDDVKI